VLGAALQGDRPRCHDARAQMSSERPADEPQPAPDPLEPEETVTAVPVLAAEVRALEPARRQLPAVQAAAVAATGFVAGAATLVALRHHRASRGGKPGSRLARRRREATETLSVVGTRRFLVDVHLLGPAE
jgi:hypothetical protein